MCYSKEVSLAVGGTLAAVSAYAWYRHVRPKPKLDKADLPAGGDLRGFQADMIAGHMCIAVHQVMEFVAIDTGHQLPYKAGLIASLSCMFFLMRGVERLTGLRYGSTVVGGVVALVGVEMFTRHMPFSNRHFWVRGDAHAIWGVAWISTFAYWNLCLQHGRRVTTSATNRRMLGRAGWAVLNVSFWLSVGWSVLASMSTETGVGMAVFQCVGLEATVAGHLLVMDTPSIWCVFACAQGFLLLPMFAWMDRAYDAHAAYRWKGGAHRDRVVLAAVAITCTVLLYASVPALQAVAVKMVTH